MGTDLGSKSSQPNPSKLGALSSFSGSQSHYFATNLYWQITIKQVGGSIVLPLHVFLAFKDRLKEFKLAIVNEYCMCPLAVSQLVRDMV